MKTITKLMTIAFLIIAVNAVAQVKKTPVKKTTTTKTQVKKTTVKNVETIAYGSFKDPRDGKVYKTIKIGKQIWMAENLAYKYTEGCWAYNNDEKNVAKYGYLYDWKTAKKVAPKGWHLPTDAEWTTLTDFLGGKQGGDGGKLKKKGTAEWISPNAGATNSSGFSAIPGGYRNFLENFSDIKNVGYWWTSTDFNYTTAWMRYIFFDANYVTRESKDMKNGYSVRLVKDM